MKRSPHNAPVQTRHVTGSLDARVRPSLHSGKERKLWLAIIGTCAVVVGVWVLTFKIPQNEPKPSGGSISELKSIVEGVVLNTKEGWKEIQAQKPSLNASVVSEQNLSELANQLVAGATTSTTTLDVSPGSPATSTATHGAPSSGTSTKARLP